MRTLDWEDGALVTIDQCALPHREDILRLRTVDEVVEAIKRLAIRGAPALGVAGAFGVAIAARTHDADGRVDEAAVRAEAERLASARPTAVNLRWGVDQALAALSDGPDAVLAAALRVMDEDDRMNHQATVNAADVIVGLCPDRPLRLLTHCNAGALATAGLRGTALGAVFELAERKLVEFVIVDETRPLLQGARLTSWELGKAGIPHRLCVDSAAASLMGRGLVDCVVVGADRITANGDVANKIGTYGLAVSAAYHGIPIVVVAPESTVDESMGDGKLIEVEERDADEVRRVLGMPVAPEATEAFNPAFDVTPAELITAVVTEARVMRPQGAVAGRAR
ncbi:translation initiation factor, aIF-2BI family [Catenulispora acidiphila DSM 44928]|uniref:Methylthioribose-1-phosphate isomerase n=1 Tax=Catenulispora acidiphila (strain DSM 44928 / JCM 14897 / NBRC 102108 / NRRL B-24433 / ID139908) TaxID=479433 RepID=C7QAC4_CATAD|nr:S-methyl-5-thioribose-1-phosphate isomerase [Catenulispora acidiphila]ACU72423.1 translation initiation factor, aIF-2BI family [Catenulispora acidiphila DSM 44928]